MLIRTYPTAAYQMEVAVSEISERQEAAERALAALEFAASLPKDRCADTMVTVSLQEVRFRYSEGILGSNSLSEG